MAKGLPSVMNHNFSNIPAPDIQRSVFDRSHGHKTTFNEGYLVPIFIDEILPGDTMSLSGQYFARLSTLLYPIMDNLFLDTFWFFVPNRLVWNNWERFNGAQDDPTDTIDYEVPEMLGNLGGSFTVAEGSLSDYFGLPTQGGMGPGMTGPIALPYRAYNLIWNAWFRDQNMQNSVVVDLDDGPDLITDYVLLKRGKRHDYFTSCLPWPQKGDAVSLPLGTTAPVIGNGTAIGLINQDPLVGADRRLGLQTNGGNNTPAWATGTYGLAVGAAAASGVPATASVVGLTRDAANSGMVADLSSAVAATVNQLREAFAFQQVIERDARGGTRYVELLKSHFGVTSPDFRLQRPEYLGGSSERISVHSVPQTSSSVGGEVPSELGRLAAFSQVATRSGFHKSFVEHGFVIGLANVRADITYQQGMERFWRRRTRYDYYLPALAHLGEQAVLRGEIYWSNLSGENDTVFGYQERWAEYRYKPSRVSAGFRSDAPSGSLDAWHLALDFLAAPTLNSTFIQDDPPVERVVATTDSYHILMDCYFRIKHARPMPIYSVPGLNRL